MGLRKVFRMQRKRREPRLPSEKVINEILRNTGVLRDENLMRHITAVRRGARGIAQAAAEKGMNVNVRLAEVSAGLHDLAMTGKDVEREHKERLKERGIEPEKSTFKHERAASEILKRKGYPEVARAVGRHGDRPVEAAEKHFTLEDRILDLVDSRTRGGRFVPLKEKLEYLIDRYTKPENVPPKFKNGAAYEADIRKKFASLQRFEESLKNKEIDVDKILEQASG